jgi:hypothetical protein
MADRAFLRGVGRINVDHRCSGHSSLVLNETLPIPKSPPGRPSWVPGLDGLRIPLIMPPRSGCKTDFTVSALQGCLNPPSHDILMRSMGELIGK